MTVPIPTPWEDPDHVCPPKPEFPEKPVEHPKNTPKDKPKKDD